MLVLQETANKTLSRFIVHIDIQLFNPVGLGRSCMLEMGGRVKT